MDKAKRTISIFPLLLLVTNFLIAQPTQNTELTNISFQRTDYQIEVLIEYKGNISYESFSLLNPKRLVLDFTTVHKVSTEPLIEINDIDIISIRSALYKPGVARVVFHFAEEITPYKIEETETGLKVLFWKEEKKEAEKKPEPEKIVEAVETVSPKIEEEFVKREDKPKKMALGLSSGYSFFQDEVFKEVYGESAAFIKGEYSFLLPIKVKSFDVWTSLSHFLKKGKTSLTEEKIKLNMTTFSFALRYLRKISRFTPFIGTGIDYIVYKEKYPEDFIIASVGGSDLGFHIQTGTYIDALPFLAAKIHIKYVWSKTVEDEVSVNLGGVEYALGLIYRFNL